MSSAELVSPGIYRIVVANSGARPDVLTRHGEKDIEVTTLPATEVPEPKQEWKIYFDNDGNTIIEVPSIISGFFLSFDGNQQEPKEGERITVFGPLDHPHNRWHIGIAPEFRFYIHAAGSDLGIKVAPPDIHPPILELAREDQYEWVFERVGK